MPSASAHVLTVLSCSYVRVGLPRVGAAGNPTGAMVPRSFVGTSRQATGSFLPSDPSLVVEPCAEPGSAGPETRSARRETRRYERSSQRWCDSIGVHEGNMAHHISYEPIEDVILDDALLADIVVVALLDKNSAAPIGLVVRDVLTLGLSLEQARTLVTLLLEAQLAVARGSDLEQDHE